MINAITNRLGVASLAGLGVIGYAYASLMWAPGDPKLPAAHLASLAAAFAIGRAWPRFEIAFGLSYMVLVAVALSLIFLGVEWNPNLIGAWMAFGLALALASNLWFMLPLLAGGLWWSQSRGALIAGGLIGFAGLARKFPVAAFAAAAFGLIFALTARPESVEPILGRMGVWQDTLNHLSFWGHGWGSFADTYASWPVHRNMTLQLAPHAYNDVLEVLSDLGIGAALAWLWIALCLRAAPWPFALVAFGFFAVGLSHSPLWMPLIPQTFALFLGIASTSPAARLSPYHERIYL